MGLRAGLLGVLPALAACTMGQSYDAARAPTMGAPTVAAASTRKVAILLPLTGANAERGQALLHAAQLALSGPGAPPLDPRDTTGTPEGAAAAARAALAAGDAIILGPLTAGETAAVAPVAGASQVAVLAFTNDTAQARPGVWTLGITPGQQVRRLYAAARQDGRSRIAAVLPNTGFGSALADAFTQASLEAPGSLTRYDPGHGLDDALRDASDYQSRRDARQRAQQDAAAAAALLAPPPEPSPVAPAAPAADAAQAAVPPGDSLAAAIAGLKAGKLPAPAPSGPPAAPLDPPPFDALLLGEAGPGLRGVASQLAAYGITAPKVRLLGPALWADAHLSALAGAWYAAPDPAARTGFEAQYRAANGASPLALSDLAYDAAAIAGVLAGRDFSSASLTRPQGFAGVDGVLALLPDGRVRRGLAVFQIGRDGSASVVQPAPGALADPGV